MGTPIINPPQSAILGMHGINNTPVVVGDKIEARPIMYLAQRGRDGKITLEDMAGGTFTISNGR